MKPFIASQNMYQLLTLGAFLEVRFVLKFDAKPYKIGNILSYLSFTHFSSPYSGQ